MRVQSALRDAHSDLAALHFANFLNDGDDTDNSDAQELGKFRDVFVENGILIGWSNLYLKHLFIVSLQ